MLTTLVILELSTLLLLEVETKKSSEKYSAVLVRNFFVYIYKNLSFMKVKKIAQS